VPRVKYTMDYRPKNSFCMSYASRKVIFPGASSASGSVLGSMPGSVLEKVLRGVLGSVLGGLLRSVLGVYFGAS
jgi:hypothetical protein